MTDHPAPNNPAATVVAGKANRSAVLGVSGRRIGDLGNSILPGLGWALAVLVAAAGQVVLWVAWRRRDLLQGYTCPAWLLGVGVLAWLVTLFLGYSSITSLGNL